MLVGTEKALEIALAIQNLNDSVLFITYVKLVLTAIIADAIGERKQSRLGARLSRQIHAAALECGSKDWLLATAGRLDAWRSATDLPYETAVRIEEL